MSQISEFITPITERPRKIAIIGAGKIGMELWKELCEVGAADLIQVYNRTDRSEQKVIKGNFLAVDQANIINNDNLFESTEFHFSNNLSNTLRNADIVIMTAGVPRKSKDQPRSELLAANCPIIDPVAVEAALSAPNATYIIATNPVDTLTQRFMEISKLSPNQIIGLSGELDRSRLVQSICLEMRSQKVPHNAVKYANVIGQHGPQMVPLMHSIKIDLNGEKVSLIEYFKDQPEKLETIKNATVNGGGIMTGFLGTSDHIAPAAALKKMTMAVIKAKCHNVPTTLYASTFLAAREVYVGYPVIVGRDGRFTAGTLPEMSRAEKHDFEKSIEECQAALQDLPNRVQGRSMAA